MPVTHQTTFSVRYYECDAYGHLNNAVYLRYMQEAAFNASAALGYGQERYAQLGRLWLARLSEVEYLLPVQYGDRVVVTTWVEDVRRVRSIRAYDFRLESSGEQVARGWTDWIYIEAASGRPSSVPAEIAAVYRPESGHLEGDSRRHFKDPPAPPPQVFTHRRQVEWQDLDPMQHVNNSVYLDYMVEAAWRFGDVIGWSWKRAQVAGFGVVARRTQIEYLQPAAYGDELEITTWLSPPQRATIERHFTMRRLSDDVQIARANSMYVCIDLASGRARRIPEEFLADILPYTSAKNSPACTAADFRR